MTRRGTLSFSLGIDDEDAYTIYDVFKGNCDISDAVQKGGICDVIASNILLSGVELELTGVGREYILREQMETIRDEYDYIILDTPPALSVLTINAYTASDELVIPMLCEILSLQGIAQLKQTIFAVQRYYNKELKVAGILLNKYNPRAHADERCRGSGERYRHAARYKDIQEPDKRERQHCGGSRAWRERHNILAEVKGGAG